MNSGSTVEIASVNRKNCVLVIKSPKICSNVVQPGSVAGFSMGNCEHEDHGVSCQAIIMLQ